VSGSYKRSGSRALHVEVFGYGTQQLRTRGSTKTSNDQRHYELAPTRR
jgi:hypothetical protein